MTEHTVPKDKTIVMVHGAFAGAWCFDGFRAGGWTCYTPDLPGHGKRAGNASSLADLGSCQRTLQLAPRPPVAVNCPG